MASPELPPWQVMPAEVLAHVFAFLTERDRHRASRVCKHWAEAVAACSVWTFTEVSCEEEEDEEEEEKGGPSTSALQRLQPYLGHIRSFKLAVDVSLETNRRLACTILDVMAWSRCRLRTFQIVCYGKSPFFYLGQDLMQSFWRLLQGVEKDSLRHVDLRQLPFVLENYTLATLGACAPDLRTLLINNQAPGLLMLRQEAVVELLRACPQLSTFGVSCLALSPEFFQELLRPDRAPFRFLDLFYDGADLRVPDRLWAALRERHPGFRVGLEFAATVPAWKMSRGLRPCLPVATLRFNGFAHMADPVLLAASLYGPTLEKVVLHTGPSDQLNFALVHLARGCPRLREVHCFCPVDQGVILAFRHHCKRLKKYTLSTSLFFCDNPPTVVQ